MDVGSELEAELRDTLVPGYQDCVVKGKLDSGAPDLSSGASLASSFPAAAVVYFPSLSLDPFYV